VTAMQILFLHFLLGYVFCEVKTQFNTKFSFSFFFSFLFFGTQRSNFTSKQLYFQATLLPGNNTKFSTKVSIASMNELTPKGRRPFFGLFLEFGQPIADAIFVQKISNFW
jgi:hypothetical protein